MTWLMKTKYANRIPLLRLWLIALILCPLQLEAQSFREIGKPYILNFNSKEYGAHTQNFSIVQDNRGLIYVANFAGILEYDGTNWRLIPTRNISQVTSLARDNAGTIFAGARGEFGCLKPNSRGELGFVSLSSKINSQIQEVFTTICQNKSVFFFTENTVYEWNNKLTIIKSDHKIQAAFKVRNKIYLMLKDYGLAEFHDRKISLLNISFNGVKLLDIVAMLPFNEDEILVCTSSQGLFMLKNNTIRSFPVDGETSSLLLSKVISCAVLLPDGSIALGSERGGILVINRDGTFRQLVNKSKNLYNDFVNDIYIDNNNFLWAALNNGLSVVHLPSKVTYFDESVGSGSGVLDILRHKGILYLADYKGLLYYNPTARMFEAVGSITTGVWSLAETDDELLAATSKGVYRIVNSVANKIADGFALKLYKSRVNPGEVYVCRTDGLFKITGSAGKWTDNGRVAGIEEEIRDIAEDKDGNLWMATPTFGILKLDLKTGKVRKFGTAEGLPSLLSNFINKLSSGIIITTERDMRKFNEETGKFEVYSLPGLKQAGIAEWFKLIVEDKNGNLWLNHGDETSMFALVKDRNGYTPLIKPFLPVAEFTTWAIYPDNEDIVWFGGPEGLIRYDKKVKEKENRFVTLIRKVTFGGDSLLFGGIYCDSRGGVVSVQDPALAPELDFENNSIRFEFSSCFYHPKAGMLYQYILEGFDKTWSEWSRGVFKEFTNLPPGNYTFRVKSRNVYGEVSPEAEYSFTIKTPWYYSTAAYICYGIALVLLFYYIVKMRSRKLLKEKHYLEKLIEDRTAEISRQKEELQNQSEQLAQKNSELERINNIVKTINSEISIGSVLQTILEKTKLIRGVEKSTALVFDKADNLYKFKASSGWDIDNLKEITLSFDDTENRYLRNTEEIYEDIFYSNDFHPDAGNGKFKNLEIPQSIIIIVVKVDEKIEGFLILENMGNKHAFKPKDFEFLKNLKEHVVSAFIKSKILEDLQELLDNLQATQQQLIQTEKLASLGQLTAGIAHEIQNPLNFVNNFSKLTIDLVQELKEEADSAGDKLPKELKDILLDIVNTIDLNSRKISEHGNRASDIVKGMLMHSRGDSGEFQEIDLNKLVDEYFHLAYHGMRAENKEFNTDMQSDYDSLVGKVRVVPQDLSRAVINIVNNACYAVWEKTKTAGPGYKPVVNIKTTRVGDHVKIIVHDNGSGIPGIIIDKICNPFFTTKPTGKGTGLGLSMTYDIITQIHKGRLTIDSVEGEYSEFVVTIPG